MSMSQEEIEALMSGLDIKEDESPAEEPAAPEPIVEKENTTMSEDDIADLIAQTDVSSEEDEVNQSTEEPVSKESIDELINNMEESTIDVAEPDEENIDDILASIDGMDASAEATPSPGANLEPSEAVTSVPLEEEKTSEPEKEAIAKDWTDNQIDQGVFPFPVEKNTKVVNQLSQVATDSEEKASKIFDVLSFILDENNEIQKNSKALDEFMSKQIVLLDSLSKKFPNIASFKANLQLAQSLQPLPKNTLDRTNAENAKLFEAMELMQFHDINRQKIERVMSVIKKLSTYLNNLFEDETDYHDVATAKHIHGDTNNNLVDEQGLDALIAEFGN